MFKKSKCRKCKGSGHICAQCLDPIGQCGCAYDTEWIDKCGLCGGTGSIVLQPVAMA